MVALFPAAKATSAYASWTKRHRQLRKACYSSFSSEGKALSSHFVYLALVSRCGVVVRDRDVIVASQCKVERFAGVARRLPERLVVDQHKLRVAALHDAREMCVNICLYESFA